MPVTRCVAGLRVSGSRQATYRRWPPLCCSIPAETPPVVLAFPQPPGVPCLPPLRPTQKRRKLWPTPKEPGCRPHQPPSFGRIQPPLQRSRPPRLLRRPFPPAPLRPANPVAVAAERRPKNSWWTTSSAKSLLKLLPGLKHRLPDRRREWNRSHRPVRLNPVPLEPPQRHPRLAMR